MWSPYFRCATFGCRLLYQKHKRATIFLWLCDPVLPIAPYSPLIGSCKLTVGCTVLNLNPPQIQPEREFRWTPLTCLLADTSSSSSLNSYRLDINWDGKTIKGLCHNRAVQLTHHDFQLPLVRLICDGCRFFLPWCSYVATARREVRDRLQLPSWNHHHQPDSCLSVKQTRNVFWNFWRVK